MLFRKFQLEWQYGLSELIIVVAGVMIALAADGCTAGVCGGCGIRPFECVLTNRPREEF